MTFTIIIAIVSFLVLIILHELGHFLLAKKFGVRVDEFGIGLPPRIIGKKFGETIYSLNLLPFGAFVRMFGEDERANDPRSFSSKPFWQKTFIVLGGVLVFWLVAILLFTIVMGLGAPTAIDDTETYNIVDAKVQIAFVAPGSPAKEAGIAIGDIIRTVSVSEELLSSDKVGAIQEFIETYKGKEIILTLQRGEKIFDVSVTPRISPPEGEGAVGVALLRTALKSYPWYQAPIQGVLATAEVTSTIVKVLSGSVVSIVRGKGALPGVEFRGPVGIVEFFAQTRALGTTYLLQLIALISISLALFNSLPIPGLDGGKLLFLIIEKVWGKPIPQKVEQAITAPFFILIILLIIFVTFKDIQRLF